jgi:hypothetical protein
MGAYVLQIYLPSVVSLVVHPLSLIALAFSVMSLVSIYKPEERLVTRVAPYVATLALFVIVLVALALKMPYIGYDFTGKHTMKYNAFVEPALSMVEHQTPFVNQKLYYADPLYAPQGYSQTFSSLPILEWTLAAAYLALSDMPLEIATRVVTYLLGILMACLVYLYTRKFLHPYLSVSIAGLVAINSIFQFASFVTVNDSILFIGTVLSLLVLERYIASRAHSHLALSAIIAGITIAVKPSAALWLLPIVGVRICMHEMLPRYKEALFYFGAFCFIAIAPFLVVYTTVRYAPTHTLAALLLLLTQALAFAVVTRVMFARKERSLQIMTYVIARPVMVLCVAAVGLLAALLLLKHLGFERHLNESFTDLSLLTNMPVYGYMLWEQLRVYVTDPVFYAVPLFAVMLAIPRLLDARERALIVPLAVGSIIYFIIASKSIFFHNYYTLIIIFTLSIFFVLLLKRLFIRSVRFPLHLLPVLAIALTWSPNITETHALLSQQRDGYYEACRYLRDHTLTGDLFIADSFTQALTLCSGRGAVGDLLFLERPEFKAYVAQNGLRAAFDTFNIAYVVSSRNAIDPLQYANLFSDSALERASYRRSDAIRAVVEGRPYYGDLDTRLRVVEHYDLDDIFMLQAVFGDYYFFVPQR